jgi:hypothetical protein
MVIGYQNLLSIPRLKNGAGGAAKDGDFVSLIGGNPRGAGTRAAQIHAGKPAILEVDIPVASQFASYLCQIRDESGRTLYEDRVSAFEAKQTVHLIAPAGTLRGGIYNLVIAGEVRDASGTPSQTQIEQLQFSAEILP